VTVQIVDLSAQLADKMPRYPSPYLPPVELRAVAHHETEGRSAQVITCGTHVSTHVDAPFHAVPDGAKIDAISLDHFVGLTRVLRLPGLDKSTPVRASDILQFGQLSGHQKVILHTGWAERMWGTQEYFIEGPYLTRDAAELLASLPRLHLLGMDFPNVDAAADTVVGLPAPNHGVLLGKGIVLLENLLHLEAVDDDIFLSAAPLRLTGGDGCPCRAVALFPVSSIADYLTGQSD
jgi:arylformamidase